MKTLYINSCLRDDSRTDKLSRHLINKIGGDLTELNLEKENLKPLDRAMLTKRTSLIEKGDFSDSLFKYAHLFAEADQIVISAPFYDLSFPALLKIFIENIYVTGLVSKYNEQGFPQGLCKASKLYYVATAGGKFIPDFCYNYIKELCCYFGIKDTELIYAEMLDIAGNDANKIIEEAIKRIEDL